MPNKKHHVKLTSNEREELAAITRKQNAAATRVRRAQALLAMDSGEHGEAATDLEAGKMSGFTTRSLERLRARVCEVGPLGALERKPRESPPRDPKVTGEIEAHIVQMACSEAPTGSARWTLEMIAQRLVELELVESIGKETVRIALKKNDLKPWQQECWCIPPEEDAAFVAAMEDVLEVYARPVEAARPLVCLDEFSKQLLSQVAKPLPATPRDGDKPGRRKQEDAEYVREGSASAFVIAAPHLGLRQVFVGENGQRTSKEYAEAVELLCDGMFPEAEKIVLVQDNLNTHNAASLYKVFPPKKARRLAEKIEWHYTPKHGSWLNIAECEISVLARAALNCRIESLGEFEEAIERNTEKRNADPRPVNWQFTTADARVKLKHLYPKL